MIVEADKCVCEIGFKKFVFELDDDKFRSLLTETLDKVAQQLNDARASIQKTKAAVVAGVPTLEEKGVEISVGIKF